MMEYWNIGKTYHFSSLKKVTFTFRKDFPEIPPAPLCKGGLGGISAMGIAVDMDLIIFPKG